MTGLVLTAAALVVACCTVHRLWITLVAAVSVLVLVPQAAAASVGTGLNVGSTAVVAIAVVQFVVRGREYLRDALTEFPLTATLAMWLACTVATVRAAGDPSGPRFLFEGVIAPVLGFVLVRRALDDEPAAGVRLGRCLVGVVAVECGIALAAWTGIVPTPWAAAYAQYYSWWADDLGRAVGTFDNPLNLGTLVVIGTCLLMGVQRTQVVVPLATLFLTTAFATQSRTALVVSLVALVVIAARRRVPFVGMASLVVGGIVAIVGAIALLPDLTDGLVEKFRSDNGSAGARVVGLTEGLPAVLAHPVLGGGQSAATDAARAAGLGTSFENAFVMLALDWGLLGTVCSFAAMLAVVLAPGRGGRAVPGGLLAGVATLATVLTFSSIGFPSGLTTVLWMTLGLAAPPIGRAALGSPVPRPVLPPRPLPQPRPVGPSVRPRSTRRAPTRRTSARSIPTPLARVRRTAARRAPLRTAVR